MRADPIVALVNDLLRICYHHEIEEYASVVLMTKKRQILFGLDVLKKDGKMKVGILHQYSLYGSGSSVYVRDIAMLLADLGHKIHLMSHEPHPDRFDFFDAAYTHRDGDEQFIFCRSDTPSCISHTLSCSTVPVAYERIDLSNTKLFVALSDLEIEGYISLLYGKVRMLAEKYSYDIIHAHHIALSPYIAYLVKEEIDIPYVVTIHGSIIEYVVLKDERYRYHAIKGLEHASKVIVLNQDVRQRVLQICPSIESKLAEIPVGVDVDLFKPVSLGQRPARVYGLMKEVAKRARLGKTDELQRETWQASALVDEAKIVDVTLDIRNRYDARYPDENITQKFAQIDWQKDNILVYFGKLLFDKGVHCLLAALPNVLTAFPDTKLIIIGSGVNREFFEMGVAALDRGRIDRFDRVMRAGMQVQKERFTFYEYIARFLESTNLKDYSDRARGRMIQRVIFTGYLTRRDLAKLLPCARATLIPSIVKEAFPLVTIESLACGVLPMASYFSGLIPILDETSSLVGKPGDLIKISHEPERMIHDFGRNITALLSILNQDGIAEETSSACRGLVEQKYGWKRVITRIEGLCLSAGTEGAY